MEQKNSVNQTSPDYLEQPTPPIRKLIAKRMLESKKEAPHFYVTTKIDMRRAAAFRTEWNGQNEIKISFNDLILKAVALALKKHPKINASFREETIVFHQKVHVGVAIALDEGLVVAVIRDCDQKSLAEIARETRDLAERAKTRKIKSSEIRGSTFTVSNLGMYGIDSFTAIINKPEAAILAVGGIQEIPVVADGHIVIGKQMKITLSSDHRVVDGSNSAAFVQEVKQLLETPSLLE